jgi:hypothetical protein
METPVSGMEATGRRAGRAAIACSVTVALLLTGCEPSSAPGTYRSRTGTVEGVRLETGQLLVRFDGAADRRVPCLITNDTEIYINDRFSRIENIQIGDEVELLGYADPNNPRGERFVLSFARIERTETDPPPIDLTPPASQPTTQPQET